MWEDGRRSGTAYIDKDGREFHINCSCCTDYRSWKQAHKDLSANLQKLADQPRYYRVTDEIVQVIENGDKVVYKSTIRALKDAPKGECLNIASTSGPHPYVCDACDALRHGRHSQLNRKLQRATTLHNPRDREDRATKAGVVHKHCSKQHIENAIQLKRQEIKIQNQKLLRLTKYNEKLLHDSWITDPTLKSFFKTLLQLVQDQKLSQFDMSFLKNWVGKKMHGRNYHADDQAKNLAILLSNKLGEKLYTTTAPILGLPLARQAQRIRASERSGFSYMPGLNEWAIQLVARRELRPIQNSMDGTRVVRIIELYNNQYLVGEMFSPSVRSWPNEKELVKPSSWEEIQDYVLSVRATNRLAAEAYSFDFVDTSGKYSDMLIGSIPEATLGVTGEHIYSIMMEVEKKCEHYGVPLIGHCTDSASNALNALIKLASPTTFLRELNIKYVGLPRKDFIFYAPVLRNGYPSIAYPCWDHSGRTVLRNLMNQKLTITASISNQGDHISKAKVASIRDLHLLKHLKPTCTIKYADISYLIKQNCDATSRVLSQKAVDELASSVPDSEGTQLLLQAAVWTHAPFRNEKFGPPPSVARSLWAGLMTWRRWRQFICISDSLSLTTNFISRSHYITEELLVHAGILHQLSLYLCFPSLAWEEYSLRNTGNRGIEAIHGAFRGGTSSLPITSPNFSYQEFLSKMNKALQISQAEHNLKQIEGNSIVASKKKRKIYSKSSGECNTCGNKAEYSLPDTYSDFVDDLEKACDKGDEDSKKLIERLAPSMAESLKASKQWEYPETPFDFKPEFDLVVDVGDLLSSAPDIDTLDKIISEALDSCSSDVQEQTKSNSADNNLDNHQAISNLLIDTCEESPTQLPSDSTLKAGYITNSTGGVARVTSVLSSLQPQREKPSKDRGKRFAAGALILNKDIAPDETAVLEFQFWTLKPNSSGLRAAKIFVLGQISLIMNETTPMRSSEICPDTYVVATVYLYDESSDDYYASGKTELSKAPSLLHVNVSQYVIQNNGRVKLNYHEISTLDGYVPFTENIDIEGRLKQFSGTQEIDRYIETEHDEDKYIVEKIVTKRFNNRTNQYEFLVKWKDYSDRFNTWELSNNIPDDKLVEFERSLLTVAKQRTQDLRPGLRNRTTLKSTFHPDFISNL